MAAAPDLEARREPRPHRRFAWIGTAASILIFTASIFVL